MRFPLVSSTIGIIAALFAVALASTAFGADDPPFREVVQLRPLSAGLTNVRVQYFDVMTGKPRAQTSALTDLWLRMWSDTANINEILAKPDQSGSDRGAAFNIELFSVVEGKLHSDTTGTCSAWAKGIAWCKYGCDGQGFELKRIKAEYPIELQILISSKPPTRPPGRGPLGLTLCGAEGGIEYLVVPADGKATAEIRLGNK